METETHTTPTLTAHAHVRMRGTVRPAFLLACSDGKALALTREDVQAIVQQAGEVHGIIAQPWTDGGQ